MNSSVLLWHSDFWPDFASAHSIALTNRSSGACSSVGIISNPPCAQMRTWADDMAAKRVLLPLEQAMPDQALPSRRSSVRASFIAGASGLRSGDADLDSRVSRLVSSCRAAVARIQELEFALKQ